MNIVEDILFVRSSKFRLDRSQIRRALQYNVNVVATKASDFTRASVAVKVGMTVCMLLYIDLGNMIFYDIACTSFVFSIELHVNALSGG